jgi:hypothetical protein
VTTVAERVAAGAAYLDEHQPGWSRFIDLKKLDISSSCRCILGQLHGDYEAALFELGMDDEESWQPFDLGFNGAGLSLSWLSAEWENLIRERRAAA